MSENRLDVYKELCSSYRAIDDFRAKLLAFLPIATGGGIFLLLNKDLVSGEFTRFFAPIGVFGFLITLGLFAYEIYGIKKCGALITTGIQLESELRCDGQFKRRPREVLGVINEPFAAGIIYPAVLAAWAFLGLSFLVPQNAWWIALAVFGVGLALSLLYNFRLKNEANQVTAITHMTQDILQAEEAGLQDKLAPLLHQDFTIVRASGEKQNRQQFLDAVPANKDRGRTADQIEVHLYDDRAVFTCRVTTTRDKDGNQAISHFWNTRLFVRENGEWRCAAWQVMKICDQ